MGSPYPKPACKGAGRKCIEEAGAAATDALSEKCRAGIRQGYSQKWNGKG